MIGKAPTLPTTPAGWRHWLSQRVLPYWIATVASEPDGYVEHLTPQGAADGRATKTTLATARLVYTFSHAHALGLGADSRLAAERGFHLLTERCWDAQEGGFFHAIAPTGMPVDRRKDAYDHAFALFAMAWLHRATGKKEALAWAERIIGYMDARLADPRAGGYIEHLDPSQPGDLPLPRRQNPHMHLLEAFHALYEATGDPQWLARAEAMVDLFRRHFFDAETGTLGEFFDADWRPATGSGGVLQEPGHHFEWVWLLHHHVRLGGRADVLAAAERLYRFALRHGIETDPSFPAAAFDEIDRLGGLVTDTKLLWPQTEAIKAHLARWEFTGDGEAALRAQAHAEMLFRRFLADDTARWHNRLARDGQPIAPDLPVRVLYHLFLCFAEMMRLSSDQATRDAEALSASE